MFGRRSVEIGDVVAIDTPYLNGIAVVIDGPSIEEGTKAYPKWLFKFKTGIVIDPRTEYVGKLTEADEIWLEDSARHMSIFGVDDENIKIR